MNSTNDIRSSHELGGEAAEAAGGFLRVLEVGLVILLALLVSPPLLTLAVVAAVPTFVVAVLVGIAFAAIAGPVMLVRRIRAHHRAHRSTLFLHRIWR